MVANTTIVAAVIVVDIAVFVAAILVLVVVFFVAPAAVVFEIPTFRATTEMRTGRSSYCLFSASEAKLW